MSSFVNSYRDCGCGELSKNLVGKNTKLAGWVHNLRNHGGVLFIDLRDDSGIIQLVIDESQTKLRISNFDDISLESVISISGLVRLRENNVVNEKVSTGEIEVLLHNVTLVSKSQILPFQVNNNDYCNEESRLQYRFLDLRRSTMHQLIKLRSSIIKYIREIMHSKGFNEFQTPILTSSSPEGARDFLVPSRLHPGKFYALPQAPQQFKQLLMLSGFDKYFQIAPCFRDEDSRADRSPGEFYQLDIEMSFVSQEDIFKTIEPIMVEIFKKFGNKKISAPFPRISYDDAMLHYGCDKPDLRNPIKNQNVTEIFRNSGFSIFANEIAKGSVVRGVPVPNGGLQPRSFFEKMISFAQENGAGGLAYIYFEQGVAKGPIAKLLKDSELSEIKKICQLSENDAVCFSCGIENFANKIAGQVRSKVAKELNLIDDIFAFCWVVDFPFYEWDEESKKIEFSHNPFSMPQGGLSAISNKSTEDLLKVKAYQYDIVCNGIELSSGAIRNHLPELMYEAFKIAGYEKEVVDSKFPSLIKAFKYGAPPHGGIAPGIDRMIMLLAGTENIRDIIAFPMNGKAEDLLMNAPSVVTEKQLRELHIKLR